jgi:hypothetical protein
MTSMLAFWRNGQVTFVGITDSLDNRNVDIDRSGLSEQFYAQNQSAEVLLPQENALDSLQRSGIDPDSITAPDEGMWLDFDVMLDNLEDPLNLAWGNYCGKSGASHKIVNASSGYNIKVMRKARLNKDIAGKQGKSDQLGPVFPSAGCRIEREENLKTLGHQVARNNLFMVVPGVKRVPPVTWLSCCVFRMD